MNDLLGLQEEIHTNALEHGFWEVTHPTDLILPTKLALVHSEVSEALEALRDGKGLNEFGEELADIIIRVLDIAGFCGFDMENIILEKLEYNKTRPYKHGRLF